MYDIVIIGGGPGGYASALYANNFGLKVAIVEKDRVGGTCLLRGCIPAKAWIEAGGVFATVEGAEEFGIETGGEPSFVWPKALERKQKVVEGIVKGLEGSLKAKGVEIIDGHGRIAGSGKVEVEKADGSKETIEGSSIILATGSAPATSWWLWQRTRTAIRASFPLPSSSRGPVASMSQPPPTAAPVPCARRSRAPTGRWSWTPSALRFRAPVPT